MKSEKEMTVTPDEFLKIIQNMTLKELQELLDILRRVIAMKRNKAGLVE